MNPVPGPSWAQMNTETWGAGRALRFCGEAEGTSSGCFFSCFFSSWCPTSVPVGISPRRRCGFRAWWEKGSAAAPPGLRREEPRGGGGSSQDARLLGGWGWGWGCGGGLGDPRADPIPQPASLLRRASRAHDTCCAALQPPPGCAPRPPCPALGGAPRPPGPALGGAPRPPAPVLGDEPRSPVPALGRAESQKRPMRKARARSVRGPLNPRYKAPGGEAAGNLGAQVVFCMWTEWGEKGDYEKTL